MKKSDELRIKTRKLIAKNLIILVALAVVAFAAAFSWFSENLKATANGISAKTEVSDTLQFYIMPPKDGNQSDQYAAINSRLADNATWNVNNPTATQKRTTWHTGSLTFDFTDQELKFMDGLFLSECTSDGSTFKIPMLMQNGKVAYVDTTQSFEDAEANNNYMSFDLYFRSLKNCSVVLKKDSKIEPVDKNNISGNPSYIDGSVTANESSMKPGAIGAVRMSVLNCESSNECELIWIPGPNVWFNGTNDRLYYGLSSSGTGAYSFTSNASGNKGGAYLNGEAIAYRNVSTTTHAFYNASKVYTSYGNGDHNVVASTSGDYLLGHNSSDDVTVVTLSNYDSTNKFYYGHIRVNLWIEGEDAEARLKLVNGKFNMNLHFDVLNSGS